MLIEGSCNEQPMLSFEGPQRRRAAENRGSDAAVKFYEKSGLTLRKVGLELILEDLNAE